MTKALIIWVGLRLTAIYGIFYLIGWFGTLNANILEWQMFDDAFHRVIFAIVFLIVTAMVIGYGYEDRNEIENNLKKRKLWD